MRSLHILENLKKQVRRGIFLRNSEPPKVALIDLDVSYTSNSFDDILDQTSDFPGIAELAKALTDVLNSAHIEEQRNLGQVQKNYGECLARITKYQRLLGEFPKLDVQYGNFEDSGLSADIYDDVSLDDGEDTSNTINPEKDDFLSENTSRILLKSLQEIYIRTNSLLDSKLHLLESTNDVVNLFFDTFTIACLEYDILDAKQRVKILLTPLWSKIETHKYFVTTELQSILRRVSDLTALLYFRGNSDLAVRKLDSKLSNDLFLRSWIVHMKIGAGVAFFIWAISETVTNDRLGSDIWGDPAFAIFKCIGDLLLLLWMWGVSVMVWRAADIDFVRLLQLERTLLSTSSTPEMSIFSAAADITLTYLVGFVIFNRLLRGSLGFRGNPAIAHIWAVALFVFFGIRLFWFMEDRKKWLRMFANVLMTPVSMVSFRDGYIGDLFTSLVKVFVYGYIALIYSFTILWSLLTNNSSYASSVERSEFTVWPFHRLVIVPFLTLFPLWIRLLQCMKRSVQTGRRWPHLGNACKYLAAIVVSMVGIYGYDSQSNKGGLWVAGLALSTIYQLWWDLVMDWGLVVWDPNGGFSLRQKRQYDSEWMYVFAIAFNIAFRFLWTLTLIPEDADEPSFLLRLLVNYMSPIFAAAEILRRMVWGFFRLEWEQLERLANSHIDCSQLSSQNGLEKMKIRASQPALGMGGKSNISGEDGEWEWVPLVPLLNTLVERIFYSYWSGGFVEQLYRLFECIILLTFLSYFFLYISWPSFYTIMMI